MPPSRTGEKRRGEGPSHRRPDGGAGDRPYYKQSSHASRPPLCALARRRKAGSVRSVARRDDDYDKEVNGTLNTPASIPAATRPMTTAPPAVWRRLSPVHVIRPSVVTDATTTAVASNSPHQAPANCTTAYTATNQAGMAAAIAGTSTDAAHGASALRWSHGRVTVTS